MLPHKMNLNAIIQGIMKKRKKDLWNITVVLAWYIVLDLFWRLKISKIIIIIVVDEDNNNEDGIDREDDDTVLIDMH